jgi:hypothetical protein
MGGCTNCRGKSGCDHRKGEMLDAVAEALDRLYPTRTWGEPDDERRAGVPPEDGAALAEELATELDAAVFHVPAGPDDPCDFLWILCVGRTPCLLQVRDLGVPVEALASSGVSPDDGAVVERYLRVALSPVAPMAAVQEIALEAVAGEGGWLLRERPRAGVYDAPLLRRLQRLVAILPAYGLLHLDFGEISGPPEGYDGGAWGALYGGGAGQPSIANYLFFPQPATMPSAVLVPVPGGEACSMTR